MTLSSDSIEVTHERVSQSYGNTIKVVSLKGARTLSFPWTMSAYSSVVKQLCKVCTAFLRPQLRGDFTMDRFFQSARSLPDCLRWIIFLIGPIVKNRRPVVVLVVRGSGECRVLTLRRHYARPSVESDRGYTKAPEGGRDKGTIGGLRRSRQIFPECIG